jgi:hypothetical protein
MKPKREEIATIQDNKTVPSILLGGSVATAKTGPTSVIEVHSIKS